MTLRSSDLQSDSDLDSIRNSCDVCDSYCAWTLVTSGMGGGGGSMVRDICLANCNLLQEISNYFVMSFCELEKKKQKLSGVFFHFWRKQQMICFPRSLGSFSPDLDWACCSVVALNHIFTWIGQSLRCCRDISKILTPRRKYSPGQY